MLIVQDDQIVCEKGVAARLEQGGAIPWSVMCRSSENGEFYCAYTTMQKSDALRFLNELADRANAVLLATAIKNIEVWN